MDGLLWIIIIFSAVVAVIQGVTAAHEMQPYIPQQFSDPLMSRYAASALIFEPRIPLHIQFKALCSTIGLCVTLGSATLLAFLNADKGAVVALFVFAGAIFATIDAARKYLSNRAIAREQTGGP